MAQVHTPGGPFEAFHAAGQLSSDGGRKGESKNPRGLSRRTAQGRHEILRHQLSRRSRSRVSDESLGRNRKEARQTLLAQRSQTKISSPRELLWASGGSGRAESGRASCQERV